MTDDIAISLKNVSKKYNFGREGGTLVNLLFGGESLGEFWALKNVSLEIRKGEKIGLIGPNGSGKSTLLRIIAGITKQTEGEVKTKGKIVSLMRLDAGFSPELSGSENIMLNGMLAGMTRDEVSSKFKAIVRFSGLGEFIKAPFYTYSDGMKFRLALSIALSSSCDILIIDEIFISGDIAFQNKIIKTLKMIQAQRKVTTIVTSHIPAFVWAFSDTFYELEGGKIKKLSYRKMKKNVLKVDKRWRKNIFAK